MVRYLWNYSIGPFCFSCSVLCFLATSLCSRVQQWLLLFLIVENANGLFDYNVAADMVL